jgi:hypothetical protein
MIRRVWRWLVGDVEHEILRKYATELAAAIDAMTPEQQAHVFLNHQRLWWHANMVAAAVRTERRRR